MATGILFVTWEGPYVTSVGFTISGQRYDASGTAIGPEFQINTTTDNNQLDPSITALDGGGFVVTWETTNGLSNITVNAQMFSYASADFSAGDDTVTLYGPGQSVDGLGGDDTIIGANYAKGEDIINGGDGNDNINGKAGNGIIDGGADDDTLNDFQNGKDKIDLKAFNFADKAAALAKFYEIGSASNDKLGFNFKGTEIIVKGIDMGKLNGADIII